MSGRHFFGTISSESETRVTSQLDRLKKELAWVSRLLHGPMTKERRNMLRQRAYDVQNEIRQITGFTWLHMD